MSGKYHLHISEEMVLALDDDGGEDIADFALSHGYDEAVRLMVRWLDDRINARRIAEQVRRRRSDFVLITPKRGMAFEDLPP